MSTELELLQKKHDRLIHLVRRMRGAQKEYLKYFARTDLEIMKRLQRDVDNLINDEIKEKKSLQSNIEFKK